jgi:hypothetical protein
VLARTLRKEARHTEVFVGLGPVDSLAISEQLPFGASRGRGGNEARKPHERSEDPAPIRQVHSQLVICYFDVPSQSS